MERVSERAYVCHSQLADAKNSWRSRARTKSSVKNRQAIEQIHGLGENRRCNLQGFEAAICSSLQSLRSRERPAASVDGLQRQSDSVPFSVRFHIVPKIRYFPT